ncbi:diacylglycerol O-acyltransferase [Prauserella marina]|uniref:Diacylglycerol O-acyltransferase n=1 Tax=Prauserella marina TaxID=530584 RepID=A0A222VVD1_9PSEU|nr:wax ester/triacylglycerol synthase family O-acyltransferase [Prauserella marina]ASR37906.1 diacylglycerol O-acyltransferase [Prauserella marina]PWV73111.1 WS/DGAT/MGAT family acyltransferase [Prauserella marina]SDD71566.1 acyltransferase, WS/DGAT/MGAT [Prauserella marina]
MVDRLSALDASFLYVEEPATPMHVGGVAVFDRPRDGFDYAKLLSLVSHRLGYLPRYRQRVLPVPGHLARPVWVDDVDFDLNYHVRRSALPEPGTEETLFELVSRLMARPLDRERPLWEIYFIEGLADGKVALVTKTHEALVDGSGTVDLGQLILDSSPYEREPGQDNWTPRRPPSRPQLVLDAVGEAVQRPTALVESAMTAARDVVATAEKTVGAIGGAASALRSLVSPSPSGPLNRHVSGGRVFTGLRTSLDDYRAIRAKYGCTVNDAVFAVLTGALRAWLASRELTLNPSSTIRALVPLAVLDPDTAEFSPAGLVNNRVKPYLVELPVGEPNPVLRLQHIGHAMVASLDDERTVAARAMLKVGGFAPATMHSLAARAASSFSGRIFNVLIANSPGPQQPLYAGSARMAAIYPVMPLLRNQALAIGITSYHGGVYFGLNGDRKALFDVDVLAGMIEESLEELKGTNW